MKDKVKAIMNLDEPKTRKQLRSFIGVVNYYRDMWLRRSHVLAPLSKLTSKTEPWEWGSKQKAAFALCKRIIAKEVMLAYPDFSKPFVIHTDASHYQLGAVISQDGKPIAFYSRKLNDAQTRYTTTERELLSIVETLKAYRNILLGYPIVVHTDHKNLVYKTFNTERVMRWRLLIEEYGPELRYIKGEENIVADVLSRYSMSEQEFSPDAFSFDDEIEAMKLERWQELFPYSTRSQTTTQARQAELPTGFPLTYQAIEQHQKGYAALLAKLETPGSGYRKEVRRHSFNFYEIIVDVNGKIVVPPPLQRLGAEWYHTTLCHPGMTRLEATLRQHYTWHGLRKTVETVCKTCSVCHRLKKRTSKYGLLPPKDPEVIPWHTLCIDLIGPYSIKQPKINGEEQEDLHLHCLTMIDPATGWFEIAEIPTKQADDVSNILEMHWLTRYPVPTEVVMDRGREFAAEVTTMLASDYGLRRKVITTRNPQANGIVERVHQVVHNMLRTSGLADGTSMATYENYGFSGILAAVRRGVNSTIHTTTQATPAQLVFGRDAILNVQFEANWAFIKQRKQKMIIQNNVRENLARRTHTYSIGDKVMVKRNPNRKHGEDQFTGPFTVVRVYDNGTLRLAKTAARGAVHQTWHIRNVDPITVDAD